MLASSLDKPKPWLRFHPLLGAGAMVLLCVAAAWLRLRSYHQSLFGDEFYAYIEVSEAHSLPEMWQQVIRSIEVSPPLYFLLAWIGHLPFGDHQSLRIPSLIAGIAVIPVVWCLARRVAGHQTAWFAALLATLSPWAIYYSGEARPYALLMLWGACLPLALLRAMERSTWQRWLVVGLVCLLGVYTHYTIMFEIIICSAWSFIVQPSSRKPLLGVALFGLVGYLPWLSQISGKGNLHAYGHLWGRVWQWWGDSLGHALVGFPYAGLDSIPGWPLLAVLVVCVVLGLATQMGRGVDARSPMFLMWLLLLAPALGLALYSTLTNVNLLGLRNWSSVWVIFPVIISTAVCRAKPRPLSWGLMVCVLIVFGVAAWQSSRPEWSRPNTGGLAQRLDHEIPRNTILLAESSTRTSSYFHWPIQHYSLSTRPRIWKKAALQHRPILAIYAYSLEDVFDKKLILAPPGHYLACTAQAEGFFPAKAYLSMPNGTVWRGRCPHSSGQYVLDAEQRRQTFVLAWGNGASILPQDHARARQDWLPVVISVCLLLALLLLAMYAKRSRSDRS